MNAIELLTQDHRKVDELFEQMESGEGEKADIFNKIYQELSLHAEAEETFFYPELELSQETSGEVRHSYHEHQEIKDLLAELAARDTNDDAWMIRFEELKKSVQHHVKEEEGELFPDAQQVLGESKLEDIGSKIEDLKKKHKVSGIRAA